MKCRKCNKQIADDSVYCKHCSEPQREKCPECGKMEIIDRPVCESKLAGALKARQKIRYGIISKALIIGFIISLLFFILLISASLHLLPHLNPDLWQLWQSLMFLLLGILFARIMDRSRNWQTKRQREAEKKFLQENPQHAEILKKAGEI